MNTKPPQPPDDQATRVYGVLKLCELLDSSPNAVRRLIWAGELHGTKIGRKVVVSDAAVRKYLAKIGA